MRQATETEIVAPLSVAQLATRVGAALRGLGDGWVEGEVTQVNLHRASGHVYLTIADESASLDACIWKGRAERCQPLPSQGELVQAHFERVDFYAPRGSTKLIIDRLEPTGEGELLRRRAETLRRLRADGLCDQDRRKPLPAFPRRVGVIAALGDANVDVIQALRKRFPPQDVVFCATSVQGVHAVGSVIDALGRLQSLPDVDVIVIARGGGSTADLVAFDDERLCRAIFACAKPVITSIGHTKDRPNCDHVAAAFAPVPAKAAELAIRHSAADLAQELDRNRAALARVLDRPRESVERMGALLAASGARVTRKRLDLIAALDRRSAEALRELRRRLAARRDAMQADSARLGPAAARLLTRQAERLQAVGAVIEAKDFRRRGWAMVGDGSGRALTSIAELCPSDRVELHFADGEASATIEEIDRGGGQ
ncbi:MAG TPA: exodeoxyribonuclease VII large subunit [Solirubrobacteraceae bacterium]|jgi:exodeoxyribonuclease VII large subunit|nr:exodeoxyribonuclease VII large subunit [Solirubrobacteraceae bacterium]